MQRVRYWDLAASLDGDYTCGVRMSRNDHLFFVEDVVHGRWTSHQRDEIILQTAQLDAQQFGSRGAVSIYIEQEPGSAGLSLINYLVALLTGYSVRGDKPTGDKVTRAMPLAAQCEAGNVRVLRANWTHRWIEEFLMFPNGRHDDQVDAASGAFAKLALIQSVNIRQAPVRGRGISPNAQRAIVRRPA